jgi:hypothetical protein
MLHAHFFGRCRQELQIKKTHANTRNALFLSTTRLKAATSPFPNQKATTLHALKVVLI